VHQKDLNFGKCKHCGKDNPNLTYIETDNCPTKDCENLESKRSIAWTSLASTALASSPSESDEMDQQYFSR
jgi:hypothetical protein